MRRPARSRGPGKSAPFGGQHPALATGHRDHRELGAVSPSSSGNGPAGHRAASRQGSARTPARPARGRVPGSGPAGRPRPPAAGPAAAGRGQQPAGGVRAEVVIPVADRPGLVQDRGHPGVLARLAALASASRPGHPGSIEVVATAARGADRAVASPQTPPGGVATRVASPPAAGSRHTAGLSRRRCCLPLSWLLPRTPAGSGRRADEQQRAVGQERRAALPARTASAGWAARTGRRAAGRRRPGCARCRCCISCRPGPAAGRSRPARSRPATGAGRSPAESRHMTEDRRTVSPGPPRRARRVRHDAEQRHGQQSRLSPSLRARPSCHV